MKKSSHVKRVLEERKKEAKLDPLLESQFQAGRLYAVISSRPGQSGRADGYILEGKELEVRFLFASLGHTIYARTRLISFPLLPLAVLRQATEGWQGQARRISVSIEPSPSCTHDDGRRRPRRQVGRGDTIPHKAIAGWGGDLQALYAQLWSRLFVQYTAPLRMQTWTVLTWLLAAF